MTLWFASGGGGGGYDYVQSAQPVGAEEGETWYDLDAGEARVYDGTAWVKTTVNEHSELSNISAGDHFDAGAALAFNSGVLDLVYGDPFAVSGDTLGLDAAAPFTLTDGSLALALGNALGLDGSDALAVQEGDISHDNLAGVSASDHHTRYSDSEARTAVDGSNVSVDHGNLTGVGAGDHHSRYTDDEARNAVEGSNISVDHGNLSGVGAGDHFDAGAALAFNSGVLDLVYGDPFAVSGDTLGLDAAAPFTLTDGSLDLSTDGTLTVDGNGNLAVATGNVDHDSLSSVNPGDHHSRYSDSEARSAVDGSNVTVDHGNLTGVSAGDHFDAGAALAFNSGVLDLVYADPFGVSGDTLGLDTVDPFTLTTGSLDLKIGNALGLNSSRLAVQEGDISHDNLAGVSASDHHSRYSDDEARSAVDGSNVSVDHGNLSGVGAGDHFDAGAALAFNSGVLDLVYADPFGVSGDTLGLNTGNALTLDGNNNLAVSEGSISHDNLAGVSAGDHHTRYSDSEARTAVDGSNVSVDHGNLTGVGAGDHHSRYSDGEARSAVDGSNVSVDHGNLSGVGASDHHSRYSDSEARTAVDGANVDIAGDADTVDGQHAGDLGGNAVQVSASDGTTHSGLSGDGDTLETFGLGSVSGGGATMFFVRITATGQTENGSGGYPAIGIRWVDSGGSEITRVDTTNWAGSSPRTNDPDGVIQFDETSNVTYTADFSGPSAAPIASGTVTAEVFDAGGGGGSSDTLASIDSILSTIVEF